MNDKNIIKAKKQKVILRLNNIIKIISHKNDIECASPLIPSVILKALISNKRQKVVMKYENKSFNKQIFLKSSKYNSFNKNCLSKYKNNNIKRDSDIVLFVGLKL